MHKMVLVAKWFAKSVLMFLAGIGGRHALSKRIGFARTAVMSASMLSDTLPIPFSPYNDMHETPQGFFSNLDIDAVCVFKPLFYFTFFESLCRPCKRCPQRAQCYIYKRKKPGIPKVDSSFPLSFKKKAKNEGPWHWAERQELKRIL
jgi:hypothetical protein